MRILVYCMFAAMILGAGCSPAGNWMPRQPTRTDVRTDRTEARTVSSTGVCVDGPTENDIGESAYPIATRYARLPHLGQIFTALDCDDRERALHVRGVTDETYVAGVTFVWDDPGPPADLQEFLKKSGFTDEGNGTWKTAAPLTMDQMDELRWFFSNPETSGPLNMEDCIRCG